MKQIAKWFSSLALVGLFAAPWTAAAATVPTLTVDEDHVTATTAPVSWTACDNVVNYTLQLASDDPIVVGGSGGAVTLFENAANTPVTPPIGWQYNIANGSASSGYLQLTAAGHYVVSDVYDTEACVNLTLSLKARTYGGTGTGTTNLLVQYSFDDGTTWSNLGTVSAATASLVAKSLNADAAIGHPSVRFRFSVPAADGKGLGISTFALAGTETSAAGNIIRTITVSGTSTTITGLDPDSVYAVRVKGHGEWSNTEDIYTLESSGTGEAPVWSALPTPSVTVGQTYELDLGDYVSGTPAPTITLSTSVSTNDYEFGDGILMFTPSALGSFAFSFTANNGIGSPASATLTVTGTGTAPVISVPQTSYNATLGGQDVEFTVTATGVPTPTLSLSSTTAAAADYDFDENDGFFTFTPSATGTFTFTFTATSLAGSNSKTVTVTVTAPVTTYSVSVASGIQNGSISVNVSEATEGTPVTVTATPAAGYKLEAITVNGTPIEGTTFSMPAANVTVGATFVESTAVTATYTVAGKTSVTVTGTVPSGSSATFASTYNTTCQLTSGNSMTLTLSGYNGATITGLTLSMRSNGSGGGGTLSATCGNATIAGIADSKFNTASWHGSWSTEYVDVTPAVTATTIDGNVVITIAATANSLYCQSFTIEYEPGIPSGDAPAWSAIPAQTVTVGQDCDLDLANYVSGTAPIAITMADTEYDAVLVGTAFSFTPDASGTYSFTFTAANDFGSSQATLTVTATGTAPTVTVTPATYSYNVTVGDPDVEFTVAASGNPAPVLSDSCTEGAFYVFENNAFLFDPDTVGTYHFVFTATNSEGSDSKTVTVTVAAPAVTVPTLTISDETENSALASWTACTGVSSYTLQLASDNQFTAGPSYSEDFTSFASASSYGTNSQTVASGTWAYDGAKFSPGGAANGTGSKGNATLRAGGTLDLPTVTHPAKVSVAARVSSGTGTLTLQQKVSGSWTGIATWTLSTTGTVFRHALSGTATSVAFRLTGSKATVIQDVAVVSADGSLLSSSTVSGLSRTFSALSPETIYYARVKGNAGWSSVAEFITDEPSATAPVLAAIADQTKVYGTGDVTLTATATGTPAPTFSVTSADAPADTFEINPTTGVFYFMVTVPGTFHFTVTAANTAGSDSKTFAVAVTGTAPALATIADQTKVLGTGDVELTASATGNPAPTYSVASSDAPAGSFEIDDATGFFFFTPAATGTFHFTVTAANGVSPDATQSFTVTVTPAAVPAPTLTISNETDTTADASWTTVSGATTYTLQLASDEHFTGGLISENFSKIAASNSTAVANFDNVTQTAGWSGEYAYPHPGALRMGNSSKAGSVQTPALTASGGITVSWTAYRWEGDTPTVAVGVSEDGGTTFSEQTVALSDAATAYSHTFALTGSSAIVRWRATAASKKRFFLDDISVTSSSGSLLFSTTTSSNSYTFTGLTPDELYCARVKAGDGDWSDTVMFATEEPSGTAPSITAIADQTYVYGANEGIFSLDVTATGTPAPTFSVASADAPEGYFGINPTSGLFEFMPLATGTFHFTVTAANGVSPDATASFAVTVTGTAPTLAAIADQTKVLGTGDVELTASATGNPAPTYSVASSDAPAGSFEIDDATGFFFFTPAATGTFHFTVTASNSVSTASRSFTVTVTPASIPAPTLTISNETDTTAEASWTAVSGASSYTLQLGSDEHFTPGPGYAEDFTSFPSASSYATNSQTVASGTWAYDGAKFAPGGAANGEGSKGNTTLRANGTLDLPAIDHPSKVSVAARVSSGTGALNLQQYASGSWSTIATWTLSSTGTVFSHTLDGNGSAVALRLTGGKVTTIYDVAVASADGSLLEEITTASTSYTFTGLDPDELYCARVKADDGDWSTTVMFATEEPAGTAPSITAIADQTYVYGANEGLFSLTATATGTPTPTFSVASSDAPEGYFTINPTSGLFEFMPLATGTFHFTVTAANGVSPDATASFAVTVTGTAPAVTPIADKTITLEDGGTEFQIVATGNPPPAFSATSTTAPSGTYDIDENGVFTFTPEAEGTYFFIVTASNSVGAQSISFAVTVAPSVAPVPELTVTNITTTSADASWTAITGALSYTLQLGTDDDFTPASGYAESFSSFTSDSSYATNSQTVSSGTWSYETVKMVPGGATNGVGSKGYAQLQASNGHLYLPSIDNPAKLTVVARASGGALTLQQQVGGTWTTIDSYTLEPTGTAHTHTFANAGTAVALRLVAGANATYVHDVSVVCADGTLVEEVTIPGWFHTFTNLSPSTRYCARVKADNSEWSDVKRFETAAPAGSAPVWSAIPAQTVAVGEDCDLDLADYVTGTAPITIGMAATEYDAVLVGTAFSFTPDASGTYTFTITAANDFGSADATLTVTATGTTPVVTVTPATYAYNVTVGDPDVEFTVTASGNPAPVLSDSCTESAYYVFENNAFLFDPDTAGTYHFVFTATNSEGSDSKTVTVTVTAPVVSVPVLTITNETSTTADASWTAVTGASSYTLQLASDPNFTVGGTGQTLTLFDNPATTPGTAPVGWTYTIRNSSGSYLQLTTTNHSVVSDTFDTSACATMTLTLKARTYGGTAEGTTNLLVQYTTDNGTTWHGIGTVSAATDSLVTKTLNASAAIGHSSVRFRFSVPGAASGKGLGISTLLLTGKETSATGSLISSTTVSGTNSTFTGLSPYTFYYARVKADGGEWSDVVEFLTDEGGSPSSDAAELVITDPYSGQFQILNFSSDRYYQLLYTTDLRKPLEEYKTLDLGWGPSSGEFWQHDFPSVDGDWYGGLRVTPTEP